MPRLAYYFDNRAEIESDFSRDQEVAEALQARFPSKLQEMLRG